jgi:hypothetical protein
MNSESHLTINVHGRRNESRWGYEVSGYGPLNRMVCGRLYTSTIAQVEAYAILHAVSTITDSQIEHMRERGHIGQDKVSIQIRSTNFDLMKALRRGCVCDRLCPQILKLVTWTELLKAFRRFNMRFTVVKAHDLSGLWEFLDAQLNPATHGAHVPDVVQCTRQVEAA